MQQLCHQVVGEGTGRLLIITSAPTKFTEIPKIRGVIESGIDEGDLRTLVGPIKISEFSAIYKIPVHTVNKLRKWLRISNPWQIKKNPNITLTKVE